MTTVTAAAIRRDNRILIGKRAMHGQLPGKWEFPGGKVEPRETPEDCLKRELYEEFGVDAAIGAFIGRNAHEYEFGHVELLFYNADIVDYNLRLTDHDETAWVTLDELPDYDLAPADIPLAAMLVASAQ